MQPPPFAPFMSLWKNSGRPSSRNTSRRKMISILAPEVKEEDFFRHVTHKTWDAILHDIRKAHEHDIDSTPDYSAAKKVAMDIRKAIQSSGDYLGKVWAVIFNMLGVDFYKLPPDEQKILKKILSKAPNIKNSPFNFRRKRK